MELHHIHRDVDEARGILIYCTMWDADQYLRYETERARPFFDLVGAVDHPHPRSVVDLGCGPGGLTATLLARWPNAVITGVDSSIEMIEHARRRAVVERLRFETADVSRWRAPGPVDVMLSNACFQWIPDHSRLLDHLLPQLADGGVLAFQVPNNYAEPSHTAVAELLERPPWTDMLRGVRRGAVQPAGWYVEQLTGRGLAVDAWEVIYYHLLEGEDPVLEWLAGTTLRPILAALGEEDGERFLSECAELLAAAYPKRPVGTIFPFRRIFVVAKAPV
jgi:trans-aconitate 2-methyltransferase